jgi:protein-tyrosine phosphatase
MSPSESFKVLFVCTGNTCRSPLAALALLDALGPDRERVRVESAGTAATEGERASAGSVEVAAQSGLDLSSHRSRRLRPELAREADLILVMEAAHATTVRELGGRATQVEVLSEWPAPGEPELPVSDPFGGSQEAYEECWRRIRRHVDRIVPQVREALRARSA